MLNILVTDDHAIIRRGLKQIMLEGLGSEVVVEEAQNAQEALDHVAKREWDVVLMDVSMPGRSGIDILTEIKKARPHTPVLFVTMHGEDQFAVRVLRAGASGFISKDSAPDELLQAIRKVAAGGRYLSDSLAEKLALGLTDELNKQPHELLSDREFQVLRKIGAGRTATQIAEDLALSVKTVSTYRARILEKMRMNNNAELTNYAIKNKLVE
ncbi:MAG: response regulator transcription factor [Verrucomicrobiales bacterium]|nr:response regulator transcription factor [Verrucomicrobiales bacterium]